MILLYILIFIPAAFFSFVVIREVFRKNPTPVDPTPRRKKRRPRHKPPLTAWTWWMYADRDTGYSFKSIRRRYESERKRYH